MSAFPSEVLSYVKVLVIKHFINIKWLILITGFDLYFYPSLIF